MSKSINFMRLGVGEMIAIGSERGEVVLDPLGAHLSQYPNVRAMAVMEYPDGMTMQNRVFLCCVARTDSEKPAQYAMNHGTPTITVGNEVFLINAVGRLGYTHFTATSVRIVPD